ncbi:16136_t:CDS:2 [Gigaspora rosea]|nr:16136_t:CDS:2 [Gigaspora rosea]
MPIHASVVVFITMKNENNSFTHENSKQFITITSATIVDKKDSTDEFNSEIIPFNTVYLMFNTTITRDLKTSEATDVDYLKQEVSYNTSKNPFQANTHPFTDLNRIANEISATTSSIHNNRTKQNDNDNEQKQNIKSEHDLEKKRSKKIKKETEKENHINIKIMIAMTLNKHLT